MAIIVEDGTAKTDSETYCSVAVADAYHAARGNTTWAAILDATKEQLLRKATDYLTAVYGQSWRGQRVTITQALDWPRYGVEAPLGVYAYNVIPVPLIQATAELALISSTTALIPNVTRGKKRVKVGPLEVEYDGQAATSTVFVLASKKIAPLLRGMAASGVMVKLQRS